MTRRTMVLLGVAFVLTRILLVWDASRPMHVDAAFGDLARYSGWAHEVTDQNLAPYGQVAIEYPPGILPFVVAPHVVAVGGDEYRERFVALMVLVDAAGMAGVMLLGWRTRRAAGPALWIAALPLLGPVAYLRLDLVPAVATIWALERGHAGAHRAAGGFWGLGIITKLYPALLLPAVLAAVPQRKRVFAAAAAVVGLVLVGLAGVLDHLWDAVIGYHGDRGIQVESIWAMGLLAAARRGYEASVGFGFGAYEVSSGVSLLLKNVATVASVGAFAAGTWIVGRAGRRDASSVPIGLYGLLALLLAAGTVLSPQFIVWLAALAAVAMCFAPGPLRVPLLAVLPIAALTQMIFPYWYGDVVSGSVRGIIVLAARNLLLLGVGIAVLLELGSRSDTTSAEDLASP